MRRKIHAGITSVALPIAVRDTTSTTGGGLSGLAYNTSGLVAEYRRQGQASWTAVTLVAGTLGTYTSGGFVADGSLAGRYEFGIPNAALASGARWCVVRLYGAANMLPYEVEFELDAVDYQDAAGFGLSGVPANVEQVMGNAATALGAFNSSGIDGSGAVFVYSLTAIAQGDVKTAMTSQGYTTARAPKLDNLDATVSSRSTYAGGDTSGVTTLLTRLPQALLFTAAGYVKADAEQWGGAALPVSFSASNLPSAYPIDFTTALPGTPTAGTVGEALKRADTNLDAAVSSRLATAGYTTPPTAAQIDTQLTGSHGPGSWTTGTGGNAGLSGPSSVTLTFHDAAGNPVPLVQFTVQGQGPGRANNSGVATFGLPDGTYTVTAQITAGVAFGNTTLTVSGTTAMVITGSTQILSPPSTPGTQRVTCNCITPSGAANPGAIVEYQLTATDGAGGHVLTGKWEQSGAADVNGQATVDLIVGYTYSLRTEGGTPYTYKPMTAGAATLPTDLIGKANK